jgi:NTE family protein
MSARLIRAHTEETLSQRFDIVRQLLSARSDPVLKIFNFVPIRSALLKPEALLEILMPSRIARDFAALQIPLKVISTDYYAQEQRIIEGGSLRPAIAASIALPALFTPVTIDGRLLMDGGLTNPLPFDTLVGEADITVAIDVSGAPTPPPGKREHPTVFAALMSSTQILQRTIVREKLKVRQPDIYIDVEVDEFYVLDFHRFKQVLERAAAAKAQLKRQLTRVLASHTAEVVTPAGVPEAQHRPSKRHSRVRKA